jgi:hypothetical protein
VSGTVGATNNRRAETRSSGLREIRRGEVRLLDLFLMGEVAPSTELLRFCCVWRFTGGGHRSEAEACQFQYDGRWRVYGVCFNAARDRANLLFPYSIDAIPPGE